MNVSTINSFKTVSYQNYIYKPTSFKSSHYVSFSDAQKYIEEGKADEIRKLKDPYIINSQKESLLHAAARADQVEIAGYLLYKGLNPDQKNSYGRTPFSIACSRENPELIKKFLLYNPDINTQDEIKNTPLHQAINCPQIVKLLLENNANPYAFNDLGMTPVGLTIFNPKSLETFLKFGVNPNIQNLQSQTLMHEAIMKNKLEIANLLKKYKADVNYKDKNGKTPLFYSENIDSLQWLLNNGAKIDAVDKDNKTLLHYKVQEGRIKFVNELLKNNANPNIKDKNNLPPLAYAKTVNMMRLLLDNGSNPDIIAPNGSTLLHNCVASNNLEAVYYFLEHQADPNIVNKNGKAALEDAKTNDIRILLLASGANPNYKNYLIGAIKSENTEFADVLLECGANPDKPDKSGKTAAFYIKNEQDLDTLIKYKADLNYYNNDGYTPMQHFALLGNRNKVNLLQSKNADKDLKSLNDETLDDCFNKYEKYNKWIKRPLKQPVFKGNIDMFGSPELRNNMLYESELKAEDIDKIILDAPTTDKGIYDAYKRLKQEESKIYTALRSLNATLSHFNTMKKFDMQKLLSSNPEGSKIPVVGIAVQLKDTVFTDNFAKYINEKCDEIKNEYESIIERYYTNSILNLILEYNELNKYLTDGIKYVNYVNGENETRKKLAASLEKSKANVINTNNSYATKIKNLSESYEKNLNKIIDKQGKKQGNRTKRKIVIKVIVLAL